ncbi:MAG: ArnT family glycosyltransferase [Thermoleophilia bacterium]
MTAGASRRWTVPAGRAEGTGRLADSARRAALGAVLALSALLNLWRLDHNGWANEYYSAAARSMSQSWSGFFFASFDPGGLVAVDKTPLSLWVQALSVRLFGYSEAAILIPEALAGVASVGVLYLLVARYWGRVAGIAAALCLAVTPVAVAVWRDNNPDAVFILLLLLAALAGARAVESGRLRPLVACGALVGLAFMTKMLLAAVVVPGIAVAYLLWSPHGRRRAAGHLGLAGAAAVAVAAAWPVAVSLTPAGSRPWVGSTDDDSIWSLILGYNGVGRVAGQTGGTSSGGGGGGAFSGEPGIFRLLNDALGDQIAWLLPLALAGGLSLILAQRLRPTRARKGALAVVGGWFAVAAVVLSAAGGIVHTYYTALLAPPLCALVGAGLVSLWRDARRPGAWPLIPLAGVGVTALVQVALLGRSDYLWWLAPLMLAAVAAGAALVALAGRQDPTRPASARRLAAGGLAVALCGLLLAPAAWSASATQGSVSGVFPGAGPRYVDGLVASSGAGPGAGWGGGGGGAGGMRPGPAGAAGAPSAAGAAGGGGSAASALAYATSHDPGSVWDLVVTSEEEAAPLIVEGGRVAAMGGFTGRETVLSPRLLSEIVASGEARYFLVSAIRSIGAVGNPSVDLVAEACTPVDGWSGDSGTLYDCGGAAAALAAGR